MVQRTIGLIIVLWGFSAHAAEKVFDFGAYRLNEAPAGFRSTVAGTGSPGTWKVIETDVPSLLSPFTPGAKPTVRPAALAQLARDRTDEHFPMLIYEEETFGDFTLTTKFKLVEGEAEQMAGVVFGFHDEKNFCYVRASALGGTFGMIRMVDGQYAAPVIVKTPITKGEWHDLRIEWKEKKIRVVLDGKIALPVQEEKTDHNGRIGFWTKSDAVSYFAETAVQYRPRITLAQTLVSDALKKHPRLLDLQIFAPTTTNETELRVVAGKENKDVGQPAPQGTRDVLDGKGYFYGKDSKSVLVIMPLHDWNGDAVAAVKVLMATFPGQTEKNAFARAMPILQDMAGRVESAKSLIE